MTSFTCAKTNQSVSLTEQIASSGEGEVWRTSRPKVLAKIYHTPDEERTKKLDIMVKHAPADPNAHKNHISFAWPQSVLKDAQGKVVGFLMPEIVGGEELVNVCNPSRRKRLGLELNWQFLHVAARNVAALVQAIHKEGYVLGDIKLQNILVNSRALPSIIDIDSFQVRDAATGKIYRCPVASEGFTPVELLGKDIATVTQLEEHDRFRLGVVMYHLLFGNHPFQGQWTGAGESPELNELIRQGFWPFAPNSLLQPSNRTIPLKVVNPSVLSCFLNCFNAGHKNSSVRPTARDWVEALEVASNELLSCDRVDSHYYSPAYKRCSWCERENLLSVDIFGFPSNKDKHIKSDILSKVTDAEKKSATHTARIIAIISGILGAKFSFAPMLLLLFISKPEYLYDNGMYLVFLVIITVCVVWGLFVGMNILEGYVLQINLKNESLRSRVLKAVRAVIVTSIWYSILVMFFAGISAVLKIEIITVLLTFPSGLMFVYMPYFATRAAMNSALPEYKSTYD
jgi:serine/threonine protein kinase